LKVDPPSLRGDSGAVAPREQCVHMSIGKCYTHTQNPHPFFYNLMWNFHIIFFSFLF